MCSLNRNIWHSSISLATKVQLYRVFILPVIICRAETWSPTQQLSRSIDAFDQWCLHDKLQISWRDRISDEELRRRTDQPPLTHIFHTTRLKFFDHIARADPSMDHNRALRSSVVPLTRDWNCRSADLVKLCFAQLNLLSLHSTLVWQLPTIEHKIDKHGNTNVYWTSHMMMMMIYNHSALKEEISSTVTNWGMSLSGLSRAF